jgi:glucose-6-phosphate isomerase
VTKNYLSTRKNIQKKYLNKHNIKKLSKNFNKIFDEVITDINTSGRTLNILNSNFKLNIDTKDLKKFKKFKDIALIGMGGSILGVKAINNFLEIKIKKKIHFFDNLDSKKILRFKKEKNLKEVLFLIISKSGDTIETLANLFTLDIIKNNSRNIIFISEKKNNTLLRLSKKFNLFYIEHRNYVGGRFSVLSEVGLIPAYLMGINIYKLRKNIKAHLVGKKKLLLKNSSIELANLLNLKKLNNLIFLNYSSELEHFLFWCQQLVAESLGKKIEVFFQ